MQHIWKDLPKPLFIQAPMEDVTDTVCRQMLARYGKPDIFFTEFTNVDGMFSSGGEQVMQRLRFTEVERPIIAQIWGANPENYSKAATYIREQGFDGIDINMGCPQKEVIKKGLCAALIDNKPLTKEIIQATKEGAAGLPVSVKTRIGIKSICTEEWIGFLLDQNLDTITVHGRTVKEMSDVSAHWDEIGKAVALRNSLKKDTFIIGNGDVKNRVDGLQKIQEFGVDGVMIGRGIFDDIRVFDPEKPDTLSISDRLDMLSQHIQLFQSTWGDHKNTQGLKKFYKVYIKDFPNASVLRQELMEISSLEETLEYIKARSF